MVSKIEEMSILEIIDKLGLFKNLYYLRTTYKFDSRQADIEDFELNLFSEKDKDKACENYRQLMNKNSDLFDKELYILYAGILLEKLYNQSNIPLITRKKNYDCPMFFPLSEAADKSLGISFGDMLSMKELKEVIEYSKSLLKASDVVCMYSDDEGKIVIESSKEFSGNEKEAKEEKEKALEKLAQIEEKIGLEKIVGLLKPTDLLDICKYQNLGNWLAVDILERCEIKNETTIICDRVHNSEIELDAETVSKNAKGKLFDWNIFYQTIKTNIQYIDIDKMLLLANAVYYNKYGTELERFSLEEARDLREFTYIVESLLVDKQITMESQKFNSKISFEEIKIFVANLNKHYINGIFYSDLEIEEIAQDMISGEKDVSTLSKTEFLETMQFTIGDLVLMVSNNPSALEFLMKNSFITEIEFEEIFSKIKIITSEQLKYLYNNGNIQKEDLISYYISERISLNTIKDLKKYLEEIGESLSEIVSTEKLVELYLDKKSKEEFDKYRRLYKLLIIDDKKLDERKRIATEILDQSLELLAINRMEELYRIGLIPLDTYIDFNGNQAVTDLFASGELKPVDARRLYDNKIITLGAIKKILRNKSIEYGQKIVLIYSTFPDSESAEIRDELLSCLAKTREKNAGALKGRKQVFQEQRSENKAIKNPCLRWNMIESLDSEYSQEFLEDGHVVFYLPNAGKYIIEKLYERNNQNAYGAATYILDEGSEKNNGKIIKDGKIIKKALINLRKEERVRKIIHTGWDNAICEYFDIEENRKYTDEQIDRIKELAK